MRRIFGIGLVAMLLCGQGAIGSSSDEPQADLTAGQIYKKMQEKYASLGSYRDQGQITTTGGTTIVVTGFSSRMARPDFYRIEWDRHSMLPYSTDDTGVQGAWSFEAGDYLQMGSGVQRQYNRDVAFSNLATTPSGGVVTVAQFFFGTGEIGGADMIIGLTRLTNDYIGTNLCFQIFGDTEAGEGKTFWIGKHDFLIHQVRTEISPDAMHTAWTGVTKGAVNAPVNMLGFTSIQTYTNIIVNKPFVRTDFRPSFPLYGQ